MGLLRNSLFIDVEAKSRSKSASASPLSATHSVTDMRKPLPQVRQRKQTSLSPLSAPNGSYDIEPSTPLPKRKSLSSILRHWRRDEVPPPLPIHHTLTPARSHQTMRGVSGGGPPSPTSSVFSTQTAPVQRFPGPGICSTLPSSSPQGRPGMSGPGNRYGQLNASGNRVYSGRAPPQRVGSTPALGEFRGPISISAPIPGVGDVPAHYRFTGERNASAPLTDMPPLHNLNGPPGQRGHPGVRQSIQGMPDRRPSMNGLNSSLNGGRPAFGPAPPRPSPPVGLGINHLRRGSTDLGHMRPQQIPQRQNQHHRPSSATVRAPASEKRDNAEYIHDSEVAALLTEAHIPPTSPVATTTPAKVSSSLPSDQASTAAPVSSATSAGAPSAWPKPSGPSAAGSASNTPAATRPRSSSQQSMNGPSSILSNVSWASIGKAKASTLVTPRASVFVPAAENVEALVDPPVSTTPKPTLPPLSAVPSPLSAAKSPLDTVAATQITASPIGFEPLSSPSSSNSSPTDPIPRTRPLSVRPKSYYSISSTYRADSPDSLYSSGQHGYHGRQESITSTILDGSHTPTGDHALSRTPSATIYHVQNVQSVRHSTLELTNARLEAEILRAKSESILRPRASYMSISAVSIGAVGDGTLGSNPDSRASYRSSQLTVRDERRDSRVESRTDLRVSRRDSRRDSRTSAVGRNTAPSGYDLSVPTLLAEIDALRRNGERLQAELHAVKSQVSFLFPPTPAELAEVEALEALTDIETRSSGSNAGTPTRGQSKDRLSMAPSKRTSDAVSTNPFRARAAAMPRVDTADGVDSDASTTPSSSASETWPITPVMNADWSPSQQSNSLDSSVSSTHKTGTYLTAGNRKGYEYPAPPMPMSRIPKSASRPMSMAHPVSSIRLGPGSRPMSGRTSTPPPRPPRAARRGEIPALPPGAAAAVRQHASPHASPHAASMVSA